jgi:hypothetical protein
MDRPEYVAYVCRSRPPIRDEGGAKFRGRSADEPFEQGPLSRGQEGAGVLRAPASHKIADRHVVVVAKFATEVDRMHADLGGEFAEQPLS